VVGSPPGPAWIEEEQAMLIDCDVCAVRGAACAGCLMSALLDAPPTADRLGAAEHRAIEVFARAGFEVAVIGRAPAPLRLAPARQVGTRRIA
jgi:hypothetical protein